MVSCFTDYFRDIVGYVFV